MTADWASDSPLHEVTWVHAFEQDTPSGSVFLRADADFPLSRRPRLQFVLHDDGSAEIATGSANDRPDAHQARWTEEGADVIVRSDDGNHTLRVVEHGRDRVVVKIGTR